MLVWAFSMSGETHGRVSPHVLFALAGIQAGVLGGFAMLVWMALSSVVYGRSPWILANLMASVLYGRAVLRASFGMYTVAGAALIVVIGGLIGVAFAMLVGGHANRVRVALLGILAGLVWYYFSQALFWNRLGVFAGIHTAPAATMAGHLLYGLVLGRYPRRLERIRTHFECGGEPDAGLVQSATPVAAPDGDTPGKPPGSMLE